MDILGAIVRHKVFGKGRIIEFLDNRVTIVFDENKEEKKFVYPSAFGAYLKVENEFLHTLIEEAKNELLRKEQEHRVQLAGIKKAGYKGAGNTQSSTVKVADKSNIAFKCNYCDGGKSDKVVGFFGICSDEIIKYNIKEAKHVWCSGSDSQCYKYLKGEISRKDMIDFSNAGGLICYESQMMKSWRAYAGIIQNGPNKGKPMTLRNVKSNSLALLTTRLPYSDDEDRFIFAVFLVHENYEGDKKDEGYVGASPKYRLQLSLEEAKQLRFWDYYYNPNKPEKIIFGSGLHRYLTDIQAAQVLTKICDIKEGTPDELLSLDFRDCFCRGKGIDIDNIPLPNGALRR